MAKQLIRRPTRKFKYSGATARRVLVRARELEHKSRKSDREEVQSLLDADQISAEDLSVRINARG